MLSADTYILYITQQIQRNRLVQDQYVVQAILSIMQLEIIQSDVEMPTGQSLQRFGKITEAKSVLWVTPLP